MLYVVVEMKTGTYWVGAGRVLGGGMEGLFWNHENVLYFDLSGG